MRMRTPVYVRFSICTLAALAACAAPDHEKQEEIAQSDEALAWSHNDAPSLFDADLVYTLADLPREGEAEVAPWAGNYWPVYQDSINHRWNGASSLSPAAKYGAAFAKEGVEDAVSATYGIDSQSRRTACASTSDCEADLGESCAKREGAEKGYCIPKWFGICHAWAPIAMMYREPEASVTRNGVEFKVQDIKALLTLAHDQGINTSFISGRCNANDEAGDIRYDEYGRALLGNCMDTNPATFHILLANYLGLRGESFVEDRTYDYEVWNQPIRSYRVTKLDEVTAQKANELVGVSPEGAQIFAPAPQGDELEQLGPFTLAAGATFRAALTGDANADLFVRRGEAPTESAYDCRPYTWGSNETCVLTAGEVDEQIFVGVRAFGAPKSLKLVVSAGGEVSSTYKFNDAAAKLYEVALEVDYITESPAYLDGNLQRGIDRYTRTDHYRYLLEEDAEGRLIGGEWLGESKRDHVDFVWRPIDVSPHSIAKGKIAFDDIMSLYYESIADEGKVSIEKSFSVRKNQWRRFGPFPAAAGTKLVASLRGEGDADLYVRRDDHADARSYQCRPYRDGSEERCELDGGAAYYVSVHGYAASSAVTLEVTFAPVARVTPAPTPEPTPTPTPADG